jgi:hypothetical protein
MHTGRSACATRSERDKGEGWETAGSSSAKKRLARNTRERDSTQFKNEDGARKGRRYKSDGKRAGKMPALRKAGTVRKQ